jgi:hypothetical protein
MSMHKLRERERKAVGIKVWRAVYEVWYRKRGKGQVV